MVTGDEKGRTTRNLSTGVKKLHWGQIKTLLIISFLILDVYLLVQFLDKKEQYDIGILEQRQSTIEEQLSIEQIKIPETLQENYEETYISVKQKYFEEEDIKPNKDMIKQHPTLINNFFIVSTLDKPLNIKESITRKELKEITDSLIFSPDEYTFWRWNKELNIIILFQNKMGRPVYFNQNGVVLLYLNNKNEIEFYTQTVLGETEHLAEKPDLIKPIEAIDLLYKGNEIFPGDDVTNVDLGFYTRVPYEGNVQVFAPTWKVNVNKEKNYFVNAIEGFTFSTVELDFLLGIMDSTVERIAKYGDSDDVIIQTVKDRLTNILEELQWGEDE